MYLQLFTYDQRLIKKRVISILLKEKKSSPKSLIDWDTKCYIDFFSQSVRRQMRNKYRSIHLYLETSEKIDIFQN